MHHPPGRAPAASALRQTGPEQQRSLSLPRSRVVLNPQNFFDERSEVEQNCGPTLPLGLGYFAHDQALFLPRFLTLWASPAAASSPAATPQRLDASRWMEGENVTCDDAEGVLTAALEGGAPSGTLWQRIRIDPARATLRVSIGAVQGQWALRLRDGAGREIRVQDGAATVGLHRYDLAELLGEHHEAEVELSVVLLGAGASVRVEEMALLGGYDDATGVRRYSTEWAPGSLDFRAEYRDGGALRGRDVFVDENSVLREVTREPLADGAELVVAGEYVGDVEVDQTRGLVRMCLPHAVAAVALPAGSQIRFFADEAELQSGAPGASAPLARSGLWAAHIASGTRSLRLGCGFSPDDPEAAAGLALAAAAHSAAERAAHWNEYWDGVLARVPQPRSFALRGLPDDEGVSAEDVRAAYYRAFLGLSSNVLPPQPESGFSHPTVATGKASMWNYGAPGARTAAAWETFLAIQYLAYLDPQTAWASFHGLMTLVVEDGSLAGEGLPSRKAQTAWLLYELTGDRAALASHYPQLRRLLRWQAEHPRWVYGDYDHPGEQDAEFLTSVVIDLGFAQQIAEVLGETADLESYAGLRASLLDDYAAHCFQGESRRAIQYWFPGDPECVPRGGCDGLGLPVVMGLAVEGLADWQRSSLHARFDEQYDPQDQLAGFDVVKHSNLGYTVAGLLLSARWEQAQTLTNIALRDVVRSGSFAEVYDRGPDRPRPSGVRPSIFGMTQVIDSVWLNNGLRMDRGTPLLLGLPGVQGGLDGLHVRGHVWALEIDVPANTATMTDTEAGRRREFTEVAPGFSHPLTMDSAADGARPATSAHHAAVGAAGDRAS